MSRFLFVVPPVTERIGPTVSVGAELAARGHDVVWTARHELVPDGAVVAPPGDDGFGGDEVEAAARAAASVRGPLAPLVQWDDLLLPLARASLPAVRTALDVVQPDMVVADQWSLAGAAAGVLSRRPWATFVPTSAGVAVGDQVSDLPDIARRVRARARRFLLDAGLDQVSAGRIDPQHSPHLVVAFTTEALSGAASDVGGPWTFVGPATGELDDGRVPFNWSRIDPSRPLVTVAFETPHWRHGPGLHQQVAGALAAAGVQAVIVGPPDLVPSPPTGTVVVPRAPLAPLLSRSAAVVCDGGHATVCRTLSFGVPLVVVPLGGDQPVIAGQVSRASGGVRVSASGAGPRQLRTALSAVLDDDSLRVGARRVGDSFATAGGPTLAADRLEALVGAGTLGAGRLAP